MGKAEANRATRPESASSTAVRREVVKLQAADKLARDEAEKDRVTENVSFRGTNCTSFVEHERNQHSLLYANIDERARGNREVRVVLYCATRSELQETVTPVDKKIILKMRFALGELRAALGSLHGLPRAVPDGRRHSVYLQRAHKG